MIKIWNKNSKEYKEMANPVVDQARQNKEELTKFEINNPKKYKKHDKFGVWIILNEGTVL